MDNKISKELYNLNKKSKILQKLIMIFGIVPFELITNQFTFLIILILTLTLKSKLLLSLYIIPYLLTLLITVPIKLITQRIRPTCNPKLKFKSTSICKTIQRTMSFPSGHTTMITALCTTMYIYVSSQETLSKLKKNAIKTLLVIISLFTALQRIAHGYHYMTDVLIGFVLGISIGYVSMKFNSR